MYYRCSILYFPRMMGKYVLSKLMIGIKQTIIVTDDKHETIKKLHSVSSFNCLAINTTIGKWNPRITIVPMEMSLVILFFHCSHHFDTIKIKQLPVTPPIINRRK